MKGPGAEPFPPGPSRRVTARDADLAHPEQHTPASCEGKP